MSIINNTRAKNALKLTGIFLGMFAVGVVLGKVIQNMDLPEVPGVDNV